MFYCNECAKEHDWPMMLSKSYGTCECCDDFVGVCNDRQSKFLKPIQRKENKDQEYENDIGVNG